MRTRPMSALAMALACAIACLHSDVGAASRPPGSLLAPARGAGSRPAAKSAANSLLNRRGPKPARGFAVGDRAVDFTFLDQYGNTVTLSKLKDQNVILDFCATWCGPCRAMGAGAKYVVRDLQEAGIPVTYVVVLFENENFSVATQTDAARWSAHFDNPWPVVHPNGDPDQASMMVEMLLAYGGGNIPTLVLLGEDNVIKEIKIGTQKVTELETSFDPSLPDPFPGGEPTAPGAGACGNTALRVGFTANVYDFAGYNSDGAPVYDYHGVDLTFPYPTDPATLPPWIVAVPFDLGTEAFAGGCGAIGVVDMYDESAWPPPPVLGIFKSDAPITISLATDAPGAVAEGMATSIHDFVYLGEHEPAGLPYSPIPVGGMTLGPFTLDDVGFGPGLYADTLVSQYTFQLVPLAPVARLNQMIDVLVADEGGKSDVDLVQRLRHALSSISPAYSTADPELSTSQACERLDSFVQKLLGEAEGRVSELTSERLLTGAAKAAADLGCDGPWARPTRPLPAAPGRAGVAGSPLPFPRSGATIGACMPPRPGGCRASRDNYLRLARLVIVDAAALEPVVEQPDEGGTLGRETLRAAFASLAAGADPTGGSMRAALTAAWDACADDAYGLALWRLGSPADAADVVQDVFVRLADMGARLANVREPRAFVLAMARRVAIDRVRRRLVRRAGSLEDAVLVEAAGLGAELAVDASRASACLASLPDVQREVIHLHHFAGCTFSEIGAITRVPTFTAASRYRLGMVRLRDLMGVPKR